MSALKMRFPTSHQRLRENGISLSVSCTYYPLRCFIHVRPKFACACSGTNAADAFVFALAWLVAVIEMEFPLYLL
jgi:hypothetical protein